MTRTWNINCDKWKKVIGITLWSGITLGLLYFLSFVCISISNDEFEKTECGMYSFNTDSYNCHKAVDYNLIGIVLGMAIAFNSGNIFMIWRTLNNHYHWLEVKCVSKDSSESGYSPREIISNNDYFKQKESS